MVIPVKRMFLAGRFGENPKHVSGKVFEALVRSDRIIVGRLSNSPSGHHRFSLTALDSPKFAPPIRIFYFIHRS
jgi:hypothetical protein